MNDLKNSEINSTIEVNEKISQIPVRQPSVYFSGPIPPPAILEKYEMVIPGAADRILKMAENQSKHRQVLEKKDSEANIDSDKKEILIKKRGQLFAFVISMTAMISGSILMYFGKPISGTIFGGCGLGSLALIFYATHIYHMKK